MKKTLIMAALVAASSVSAFATSYTYVNNCGTGAGAIEDGTTYSDTYYTGSWKNVQFTLIAEVDLYALATDADLTTDVKSLVTLQTSSNTFARGFGAYLNSENKLVLAAISNGVAERVYTTTIDLDDSTSYSQGDKLALTLTIASNGADNPSSVGNYYYYDGTTNTGVKTTPNGDDDKYWSDPDLGVGNSNVQFTKLAFGSELGNDLISVYVYDAKLADNTTPTLLSAVSTAYNTKPIPEPATATLSLLALAGLCARRRRK